MIRAHLLRFLGRGTYRVVPIRGRLPLKLTGELLYRDLVPPWRGLSYSKASRQTSDGVVG
jgi:hypothetical protein